MFDIKIMLMFMLFPLAGIVISFVLFKRKTMNFLRMIIPKWNKRYVICHLRFQAGLEEIHNVIPNQQGLTKVGEYAYLLSEKYIILTHNKRVHYILNEADAIPAICAATKKEDIIFQAAEIQTALDNNVMEYLFSQKKDLLIWGLFILIFIAIAAIGYNIVTLGELKTMLSTSTPSVIEVK